MGAFKSGFVSIIGKPNVGKSTLLNALIGQKLAGITPKAQTTRHRIMGIVNGEGYQIVYSDTPGLLQPKYALHKSMMNYVNRALEDADLILLVVEWNESADANLPERLRRTACPVLLVINKWDLAKNTDSAGVALTWKEAVPSISMSLHASAKTGLNMGPVLDAILTMLPEHPPYFPPEDDHVSNRTERFFTAEIIREKIFLNYEEEVPYSTTVVVTSFKDEADLIRIAADIFVERDSQKAILIGKKGSALKLTGTQARYDLEAFFGKKIFLETHVKVASNWRQQKERLKQFGYTE